MQISEPMEKVDMNNHQGQFDGKVAGQLGKLSTRLAESPVELRDARRLRYQVFYREMAAKPNLGQRLTRMDLDKHDRHCDHLLVLDETSSGSSKIIGTQRFLTKNSGNSIPTYASQGEFDLEGLHSRHGSSTFMELGRSCILAEYRSKRTAELMWHGTWAYAVARKVDVMVGCASFPTSNVEEITPALQLLDSSAPADGEWQVEPASSTAFCITKPADGELDTKSAIRQLPPLIRGYLRLGAMFSMHAVPDPVFGTIDVLVVLPVSRINPRYVSYYGSGAERHAS